MIVITSKILQVNADINAAVCVVSRTWMRVAAFITWASVGICSQADTRTGMTQAKYMDMEKMAAHADDTFDVERLCAADSLFDSEFGKRVKAADRDGGEDHVDPVKSKITEADLN